MLSPTDFKSYYLEHRVPNPVNITLTQRQVVDGQWITDTLSQQNFRHCLTSAPMEQFCVIA